MTLPLPTPGETGWGDELNAAIAAKAEQSDVDTALAGKADLGGDGKVLPAQLPTSTGGSGYDPALSPARENYVRDPSFDNLGTWNVPAGGSYSTTTPHPDDGNGQYASIATQGTGATQTFTEDLFRVTPGDVFEVESLYRRSGASQATGRLYWRFYYYDKDKAVASGAGYYKQWTVGVSSLGDTTWRNFSGRVTIPDGVAYGAINFGTYIDVPSGGAYDWDFVSARKVSATTVWNVGPDMVDVESYGVSVANSGADNDTAMARVHAEHPAGEYIFPRAGNYAFNTPFAMGNNRAYRGTGRATKLQMVTGLWAPTSGGFDGCRLEHLYVTATSGGTTMIDFSNADYVTNLDINDVLFDQVLASGSTIKDFSPSDTHSFYGLRVRNSEFRMAAVCGDPAIYTSSPTVGINDWLFDGCMTRSNDNANTVFLFMEYTGSTYGIAGLRFQNIVAEQPKNGWCNIQGATNPQLENIVIYDDISYTASIFRFDKSGNGTQPCQGVSVNNCGTASSLSSFPGSGGHVRITNSGTSANHNVGYVYNGDAGAGTVLYT